jgi:CRISPR-associated protein Cas1
MALLINTYGTRIRSSGERITLNFPNDQKKKEYSARRIEKIIILRPSSISMGTVQLAIENNIDIVYLGSFGKPAGRIFPSNPKGVTELRRAQLSVANSTKTFSLAKTIVKGKTKNQIAYLRQLQYETNKDLSKNILQAETILSSIDMIPEDISGRDQLFGIEGYIAEKYFSALKKIYRHNGRNPQKRDKFNSVFNYGYGILYNEVERACSYIGLDPYLGLYHSERYGKPSLVLDLVEEFRVPLIDSIIFPLFVNKKITAKMNFDVINENTYRLSPEGRRKIVEAVYENLNRKIKWAGKQQAVKSCITHQVRTLGHIFLGKKNEYIPFEYKHH